MGEEESASRLLPATGEVRVGLCEELRTLLLSLVDVGKGLR